MTDSLETPADDTEEIETRRRELLTSAAAIAGAGAIGAYVGTTNSEAAPTGTFPESTDDALLKIRADRVRWIGRTSDPSSPNDGVSWYRSDQ